MAQLVRFIVGITVCCAGCTIALGDDWPQWLGPKRDSVWREKGIVKTFPKKGLKVKWRTPIAGGSQAGVFDETVDVEYTFYGLGALALLGAVG